MRYLTFILTLLGGSLIFLLLDRITNIGGSNLETFAVAQSVGVDLYVRIIALIIALIFMVVLLIKIMASESVPKVLGIVATFLGMGVTLIVGLGVEYHYWYIMAAIIIAVAAIFAHPISITPTGSMETLLRFISVSALSIHTMISTEAGQEWAITLLVLSDNPSTYINLLYLLAALPLSLLIGGMFIFRSDSGIIVRTISGMAIPFMIVSLIPLDRYGIMVIPITSFYIGSMMVIFGVFTNLIMESKNIKCRITSRSIVKCTLLNKSTLKILLPRDVYLKIYH